MTSPLRRDYSFASAMFREPSAMPVNDFVNATMPCWVVVGGVVLMAVLLTAGVNHLLAWLKTKRSGW